MLAFRVKLSACFALSLAFLSSNASADKVESSEPSQSASTHALPLNQPSELYNPPLQGQPEPYILPPPIKRRWYGAQILIPMLAFDGLALLSAIKIESVGLAATWIVARGLTGPFVHGVIHGHGVKALTSLGLEGGGTVVGGGLLAVGVAFRSIYEYPNAGDKAMIAALISGGVLLVVGGTVVDIAIVANEDVPSKASSKAGIMVLPYITPMALRDERTGERKAAMSFGLTGHF